MIPVPAPCVPAGKRAGAAVPNVALYANRNSFDRFLLVVADAIDSGIIMAVDIGSDADCKWFNGYVRRSLGPPDRDGFRFRDPKLHPLVRKIAAEIYASLQVAQ